MASGSQVKNGKAFEFAIAKTYAAYLQERGLNVTLDDNSALNVAQRFYQEFPADAQRKFDNAAFQISDLL